MENIVCDRVYKKYGEKSALREFSAVFPAGEVTCLMAPSGRGKTTLLRLLLGLTEPSGGTITGVPEKKAAVFQEDRLCPGLSALENVTLVIGKKREAEARSLLTRLGLGESADTDVELLSGGMRRRTALARALVAESDLLVLDEPFTGLDEENRANAAALVRKYTVGKTVIFVTHDADECALLGGSIVNIP